MPQHPRQRQAALISLGATILVVCIKLVGAWLSGSVSVLAEALQSTLDIVMSGIVVWALHVSSRPADQIHPFGHAKAELLASLLQMILAMGVAVLIIVGSVPKVFDPQPIRADWGLGAMSICAVINLFVIAFLKRRLSEGAAPILASEVAHLWSDTFASVGVMVGLALTWILKIPILDPIAAIFFTAIGGALAAKQVFAVIHPLMDGALPDAEIQKIKEVLDTHPDVRGYHNVMTRSTGRERRVELHVMFDDHLTFVEAHDLCEQIEEEISKALGGAWTTIHYEPWEAEEEHQRKFHGR